MRAAASTPGYALPMLHRIAPAALILLAGCDLDTILDAFNEHAQATRAPHTAPAIPGIPGLPGPSVPTGRPPPPSAGAFVPSPQAALGAPVDQTQQDELLLVKPQYVLSYNRFRNAPNWAAWRLSASDLGDTGRTRSGFAPDAEHEGVHGASELTSADVESASRKSARERPRGRQRRVQLERRSDDGYDPEEEPN